MSFRYRHTCGVYFTRRPLIRPNNTLGVLRTLYEFTPRVKRKNQALDALATGSAKVILAQDVGIGTDSPRGTATA
jgi:hypothetical protein